MGMGKILKQAQKMQREMERVQEELAAKELEVTAGGGMVTIKITGEQKITGIKIKPEVVKSGDIEDIEDLIVAAVNQAIDESKKMMSDEMGKITGGLNIPGFGLGI
ncbi:YbaB/EbfC family nucleoid-associated protein [bacterium]|nr:YbaB/EbfC family nucleoid-associated protein [bacterium]MCP5462221.1 YbaB/EbfC family nucleoid-associated protein [bacterium]